MKKTLYIVSMASLLTACYEDKGNYDYTFDQMNEITEVTFTPGTVETIDGKTIEFQQPLSEAESTQRVEVALEQTLASGLDNLDFSWVRTYTNEEGVQVKDTLYTKGYMEVYLPVGQSMRYDVLLEVKDRTTTLANYTKFVIKTRPIFKNSLFFLHGAQGARKLGNIEVIGAETKVRTDAYQTVYPENANPFGDAISLCYNTYYDLSMNDMKQSNNLSIYTSTGTASVYEPFGLSYKFNPYFVLPTNAEPFVYSKNVETGDPYNYSYYRCALSKDGRFYIGNHIVKLYIPGEYMTSDPNHQTDYRVEAATITNNHFVLWDAKNNRFLYMNKQDGSMGTDEFSVLNYGQYMSSYMPVLDAHVDFSLLPPGVSPVGKKVVYAYIQYRENYEETHPFFIFKDEETGKFYQYELTPLATDGKGDGKNSKDGENGTTGQPAFSISYREMVDFEPGDNLNLICYNSYFTTNYIFYADGSDVYRYNISNGDKTLLYSVAEGYTISVMKFRVNNACSNTGDLGYILTLGLNKGSEGAIAEIKLNTASDLDEEFTPLFYDQSSEGEKLGNIQEVQFAHEYMYQITTYN